MKLFAQNYRGFKFIEIDLNKFSILCGDNSSGKSSALYLIDLISKNDLEAVPTLSDHFGASQFDYFSPYFNNADVTFGFYEDKDGIVAKLITVARNEEGRSFIKKCTCFADNKLISYAREKNANKIKMLRDCKVSDAGDMLKKHELNTGYKKMKRTEHVHDEDISSRAFLAFDKQLSDDTEFDKARRLIFNHVIIPSRLVSPIRALPEIYYKFKRKYLPHGSHFATMFFDIERGEGNQAFQDLQSFGSNSGLFSNFNVDRISNEIDESPLIVTIERNGKKFFLNQVGIGVSQVFPVLMDTIFSMQVNEFVLIQQPELHLHPVAQSELGTFFFKCCKNGLRGAIETHSSFVIDRFKAEIRDSNRAHRSCNNASIEDIEANIVFFEATDNGNNYTNIEIDLSGQLVGDPDNYHRFFIDEMIRTMV